MYWQFTILHIPRRHLRKRKSWTIIGLFYVPLEVQPKMKNWIYHHSTGFLKLHKCPFKQRYIAGSANCSTKHLSKLLLCILSAVKTGLQSYGDTSYSRGSVIQMWILKKSKDLLEYIQSRFLCCCNIIKTFDFSTLYTAIPHSKLKVKLRELVQLCFIKKNGQRRYKYLVRDISYFVKHHSDSTKKFSEIDIFNMLEFLIDNIFVMFGGRVLQQTVGIPMGTNCAVLLFSPTCSFIRMRHTAYRGFSRKTKRS